MENTTAPCTPSAEICVVGALNVFLIISPRWDFAKVVLPIIFLVSLTGTALSALHAVLYRSRYRPMVVMILMDLIAAVSIMTTYTSLLMTEGTRRCLAFRVFDFAFVTMQIAPLFHMTYFCVYTIARVVNKRVFLTICSRKMELPLLIIEASLSIAVGAATQFNTKVPYPNFLIGIFTFGLVCNGAASLKLVMYLRKHSKRMREKVTCSGASIPSSTLHLRVVTTLIVYQMVYSATYYASVLIKMFSVYDTKLLYKKFPWICVDVSRNSINVINFHGCALFNSIRYISNAIVYAVRSHVCGSRKRVRPSVEPLDRCAT